jgi:hypothetical protein
MAVKGFIVQAPKMKESPNFLLKPVQFLTDS